MSKPKVICHMMSTVDGRILTANWGSKYKALGLGKIYETIHETFEAEAWLCGRVTMEKDFTSGAKPIIKPGHHQIERKDFVADPEAGSFAVAIDQDGKLGWDKPALSGDHVIAVLAETVKDGYLAHLQDIGVSYIFGGKDELDFSNVLKKLGNLFGIKTVMLEGGGHLNGSFLNAGQIDELSLLVLPLADGTAGTATVFEVSDQLVKKPSTLFKLEQVKKLDSDVVWLHYKK